MNVKRLVLLILCCIVLSLRSLPALAAGDFVEDQPSSSTPNGDSGDSTFDPFSDYSEFEEGSDEEADLNFFHNGRFFSIGFIGGYETFTNILGTLYSPGFSYGLFLNYFFDLRLALQLSYNFSSHNLNINTSSGDYTGTVTLQRFAADFKYYLNTQNVTRGLAKVNPYLIGGFSSYTRATNISTTAGTNNAQAYGIQAGVGIEVPIMRNKAYIGAQGTYNYVSFPDENQPITVNGVATNIYPQGDAINLSGTIGMNF